MSKITHESTRREYLRGVAHNSSVNLSATLKRNNDFYAGKQWEGLNSPIMPAPVFNFVRRAVIHAVQSVSSTSVGLAVSIPDGRHEELSDALNREFSYIFESNELNYKFATFLRNTAVLGASCLMVRWDPDAKGLHKGPGAIVTEAVDNERVFFGAPTIDDIQEQPFVIVTRPERIAKVRRLAAECGTDPHVIRTDAEAESRASSREASDYVTVLQRFWRSEETRTIWCYECCRDGTLRRPWDTGLSIYPLIWMTWDSTRETYHGRALVTSLVPNQIFVNKLFAMSMLSLMSVAHPKIIYDRTRIARWDNRAGAAIPMLGGDVNSVARVMEAAHFSPQVAQFIDLAITYSQSLLGATPAALGEVRPDNSSAIIALQKAATMTSEDTRVRYFKEIERYGRIVVDMLRQYGTSGKLGPDGEEYSAIEMDDVDIRLDVGMPEFFAEYTAVKALENMLAQGRITFAEYLERMPDKHIPGKKGLLARAYRDQEDLNRARENGAAHPVTNLTENI